MNIHELRALKDLQLESVRTLKRKLAFWDKLCTTIQCKRDKIYRQHSLTVRAYQQTDLQLAQLDGRLQVAKPKTARRSKPRQAKPDTLLAAQVRDMLKGHGLSPEQQSQILKDLGY